MIRGKMIEIEISDHCLGLLIILPKIILPISP